jgi:hypothetical protein
MSGRGWVRDAVALTLLNGCYVVGPLVLVGLPVWLLFTPWWWLGVGLITAYLYLSFDGSERRLGTLPIPPRTLGSINKVTSHFKFDN